MLRAPRPPFRRPLIRPAARGKARARLRARLDARTVADLFGSAAFLVGSLLFLSEVSETAGVWLFVAGSGAMLGSTLARVFEGDG